MTKRSSFRHGGGVMDKLSDAESAALAPGTAQPTSGKPAARQSSIRASAERRILGAAESVFAEQGLRGASMRRIAERAGLPTANLHYYFSTKEALYRRVVERICTVWLDAAAAFDAASDPRAALTAYIDAKMELSRTHRDGSKVWATEIMQGAPVIQDYLETTLMAWTESREAAIRGWIEKGLIRPIAPRHLLFMIWATTQHYADFAHQIETLNGGAPLRDPEWAAAKRDVTAIILSGLGLDDASCSSNQVAADPLPRNAAD